jgi:hypothetical protein
VPDLLRISSTGTNAGLGSMSRWGSGGSLSTLRGDASSIRGAEMCTVRVQFIDGSKTHGDLVDCGEEDTFEVPDMLFFSLSGLRRGRG